MWSFIQPLNLMRYLCVWRVNRALVRLPKYLSAELASVLGTIIAERLPTAEARPWQKALNPPTADPLTLNPQGASSVERSTFNAQHLTFNVPAWPVEAVLLTYPGKTSYGPGEVILWELKLLGSALDHGFFLEVILPALEAAGQTNDPRWYQSNSLWGRFDIQAIYAARGPRWEPVVSAGRLNLRYRAEPLQWADGLTWQFKPSRPLTQLTWLTPFDLSEAPGDESTAPTLQLLIEALLARMARLLPGKYITPGDVWNLVGPEEQAALWDALAQTDRTPLRRHNLNAVPKDWPGRWLGQQTFAPIRPRCQRHLELASILHLG
ncbi:MAG: hypothetical protein U0401_34655 [Anaerolineae bacterium]